MANRQRDLGFVSSAAAASHVASDLPSPLGFPAPLAERRLAYLRQIELARLAGVANSRPYHQSKHSDRLVPGKIQGSRRDSTELALPGKPVRLDTAVVGLIESLPMRRISFYQPFKYFRKFALGCLVLFSTIVVCDVAYAFAFGRPELILRDYMGKAEGVYQGFHCGWSVEIENPYTCDL